MTKNGNARLGSAYQVSLLTPNTRAASVARGPPATKSFMNTVVTATVEVM